MIYMSHHYARCRSCGRPRSDMPISSRGLCGPCGVQRAIQSAAAGAALAAAVQVKVPDWLRPPPLPVEVPPEQD
jgi:hypothetical protein